MDSIWENVRLALKPTPPSTVVCQGIILSTQMHGFVLSDPDYGPDVYISWQDARCLCPMPGTNGSYLAYLEKLISPDLMRSTGVYLKPALGMCNLFALIAAVIFIPAPTPPYILWVHT